MVINFSNEPIVLDKNSIFLAGPTVRGGRFEDSWRKKACFILGNLNYNGRVYVPEYYNEEWSTTDKDAYLKQCLWERSALMGAGVILFYFDRHFPELPALTTNVEFGMYLTKKPEQCVVCIPEGSNKNKYIEWLYEEETHSQHIFNPIARNLEDGLYVCTKIVSRICKE